jgi:chemotaxis signal transduction protein
MKGSDEGRMARGSDAARDSLSTGQRTGGHAANVHCTRQDTMGDDSAHDRTDTAPIRAGGELARMRRLLDRPLSTADIEENTANLARASDDSRTGDGVLESVLIFRIGGERLAVHADEAHRVVPLSTVRRVPHRTGEVFAGVANIGGELTLVGHLGAALGIAAGPKASYFIVIGNAGARWAFAVDAIEGVRRVRAGDLVPPPATVRHAVDGCARCLLREASASPDGSESLVTVLDGLKACAILARSIA